MSTNVRHKGMACIYCKSLIHEWYDCKVKPDGWKPAFLNKPMPHANGMRDGKDKLPDPQKQLADASIDQGSQGFESPVGQLKRPRGRPKIHPDRKAYKAAKEREYRARKAK